MIQKKQPSLQLRKLAQDLGLQVKEDPKIAILHYCENRIQSMIAELGECESLADLLEWVANRVGTIFRLIQTNEDLTQVKQEFLSQGEKVFANLEAELSDEVYGVTFRRRNAQPWEPPFISIIDCRGEKATRCYFTKWHEIAHLLTLTQQMRLVFKRTHSSISGQDPEETLMDAIAGKFGFYGPVFQKFTNSEISFVEIEMLRQQLCPEASQQASLINFVKYWKTPCIYVKAELGLKKRQEEQLNQRSFDFAEQPEPVLRAVKVAPNEIGWKENFILFENMRIPESSIIYRAYFNRIISDEAEESLSSWSPRLSRNVKIKTRLAGEAVEALIIPL